MAQEFVSASIKLLSKDVPPTHEKERELRDKINEIIHFLNSHTFIVVEEYDGE